MSTQFTVTSNGYTKSFQLPAFSEINYATVNGFPVDVKEAGDYAVLETAGQSGQAIIIDYQAKSATQSSTGGTGGAGGAISTLSSTSCLGDSIMWFGMLSTAGTGALTTGSFSNSHVVWCNDYAMSNSLNGFDVQFNYAAGGKTLFEIRDEQVPLAVADSSQIAWIHGGVNDINTTSTTTNPVATMLATLKQILDSLSAVKKVVIVDSLHPLYQSGITSSKARAFLIPLINAGYRNLCSQYSNVIFNDTYSAMVDTTSANLDAKANYLRADDGIHLTSTGAQAAGYASFNNIIPKIKITKYKTVGANLLPVVTGTTGGTSTAGTGTVSGVIPLNWNIQVASGNAAVVSSALAPDMWRLSITNPTASASTVYLQVVNPNTNVRDVTSIGDKLQGGFTYQVSGNTLLNRLGLLIRRNTTFLWQGGYYDTVTLSEPTITYPQAAASGVRTCLPYDRVSSSTLEFIIAIQVGASTGATTVDISNVFFSKLT